METREIFEANAAALEAGLPAGPILLTVLGEPASKANSRKLVTNPHTRRPMFIKSAKAIEYVKSLGHQVPRIDPLLTGDLIFTATIYYASERPDLDESLILDGLQKRIYANDRQVRVKHIYHAIDRSNPRAEIVIELRQASLFGAVAGEAA